MEICTFVGRVENEHLNLWFSGRSLIGAIYLSSALDIVFLLSNKKGGEVQLEMLLGGSTYLFTRCVAPI